MVTNQSYAPTITIHHDCQWHTLYRWNLLKRDIYRRGITAEVSLHIGLIRQASEGGDIPILFFITASVITHGSVGQFQTTRRRWDPKFAEYIGVSKALYDDIHGGGHELRYFLRINL